MKLFVGLDVSLEKTAICVISEHGKIMKEVQVASEPDALLRWIREPDGVTAAIGLELGPCRSGCIADCLRRDSLSC